MSRVVALSVREQECSVCRLPTDSAVPMPTGGFWSVTRTATELSIVCLAGSEPTGAEVVGPWRVLSVDGPLDFALVGILESLLAPLAAAEISVFTVSTFDTDHLLVRAEDLERTIACLRSAGHTVI